MANQDLFEKYGIKEVADVTFYQIKKKKETYEIQREILVSSVVKGAVKLQTVYPLDTDGVGEEEGFEAYVFSQAELLTGTNYDCDDVTTDSEVGTHEYAYEEQLFMLFAKNQNLIKKTGVRYQFTDTGLLGNFEFSDDFAAAPNSTERVVVLVYGNKNQANSYDIEEINAEIDNLITSYSVKAYDVMYKDYAELIVEDEMGYYNPDFLGTSYTGSNGVYTISGEYADLTDKDPAIANATMWGIDTHASINDAIEALRAKKKVLDTGDAEGETGVLGLTGGYDVGAITAGGTPNNTTDDAGEYTYAVGSTTLSTVSKYALSSVLDALSELSITSAAIGEEITVTDNGTASNRAIYVKTDVINADASAYIYLLRNKDYRKLSLDQSGLFIFKDNKGNTCYYKDTIFVGVEYLALVVIGGKGLIFTVGRNGTKKTEKIAWMVNENGYLKDSQAEALVKNGLIHTVDVMVNDETFEATCSVSGLKNRRVEKTVLQHTPVLFLDTLKVSTLEQTAEQTSATGGKGNSQLLIWDYGKEITLTLEDALFTPASMSAIYGASKDGDFVNGVKDAKSIDRFENCTANRSFIVPAGNSLGVPSDGEKTAQAVYFDKNTMKPFQDGTPIAEGEVYLKWTRSVAYGDNSLGSVIEISADQFPGTYKVVGDTFIRNKTTGEDQRFQIVINQAKMSSEQSITLEADGDPTVFNMTLNVLRPDNGKMISFIQYDVVENVEENDGSTMVKGTENLNILDDAEMFKVNGEIKEDMTFIGATEY